MLLLIRGSKKTRVRKPYWRVDLGTAVLMFPFFFVWFQLKKIGGDFLGLIVILFVGLYIARRSGITIDNEKIVKFAKEHLHMLLIYGGLVMAVVLWMLRTFLSLVGVRRTSRRR